MSKIIQNPLVSVVVTTRNEEKNINTCLNSILCQTYPEVEIIVVDNKSTDKTKLLSKKFTDKVFDKGPERSAQRNYGLITKSKGEYVMFVDADMVLGPRLIEEAVKEFQSNNTIALFIPEIVLGKKFFSRVRRFERTFYDGTVIDGARFFKKKCFEETGGFDEKLHACEDWDLDKRLKQVGSIGMLNVKSPDLPNWKLATFIQERGVSPKDYLAAIFHNESEFNLVKYLGKKGYYAQSFNIYQEKWLNDPDIKKQFGLSYRFFGVFVEKRKWFRLLSHPVLTFGMYFLRFLVGWQFLCDKIFKKNN